MRFGTEFQIDLVFLELPLRFGTEFQIDLVLLELPFEIWN